MTALVCALVCALYLWGLSGMGLVGPDEPRYADIGRTMAHSGDWITPTLWGKPWFEKPPMLYWLTAGGFVAGLGPEWAPRLPVALLALWFLAFFWFRVTQLWGAEAGAGAAVMLATSAGWLAYSHVAITDVPMAAFFSAAVLLALPEDGDEPRRTMAAAALGLAVLAKSLPPVVLFLPVLALDWRNLKQWLRPAPLATFFAIAAPWHVACAWINGGEFWRVLFLEHQFGRFTSGALQHVQPFWYYVPVLAMLLFPWFPVAVAFPRDFSDRRLKTLAAVAGFGFLFFSASKNKLPSYLLPLLPAICALLGVGLARAREGLVRFGAGTSVVLLILLPLAAEVLPQALAHGLRSAAIPSVAAAYWIPVVVLLSFLAIALPIHPARAAGLIAALSFLAFEVKMFPVIDQTVSARPVWLRERPDCARPYQRSLNYGLDYYAGRELPWCQDQRNTPVWPKE